MRAWASNPGSSRASSRSSSPCRIGDSGSNARSAGLGQPEVRVGVQLLAIIEAEQDVAQGGLQLARGDMNLVALMHRLKPFDQPAAQQSTLRQHVRIGARTHHLCRPLHPAARLSGAGAARSPNVRRPLAADQVRSQGIDEFSSTCAPPRVSTRQLRSGYSARSGGCTRANPRPRALALHQAAPSAAAVRLRAHRRDRSIPEGGRR